MKIALLSDAASPITQRWADSLAARGHIIHLFSRHGTKYKFHKNVKLYKIPTTLQYITFPFVVAKMQRQLDKIQSDVVHAHDPSNYGIYASCLKCKKLVITCWGFNAIRSANVLQKRFMKIAFDKAYVIEAQTEAMKKMITGMFRLNPDKIITNLWGAEPKLFHIGYKKEVARLRKKLGISQKSPVILSFRNMREYYGIHLIVEAIPNVLKKHPGAVFIFIRQFPDSEYAERIQRQISELGVSGNVRIIDRVEHGIMPIWVNMSDISLHLPITDNGAASLPESMMCGSVVIASDTDSNRERIKNGHNGLLVKRDPKQIAEKISYCLEHRGLKQKLYKNSMKTLRKTGFWQDTVRSTEELYKKLAVQD